ncbi:16S rRNA (cytidine(1402)-2'-O)-methyltransferase [Spiroplasma chrysopicola]|uniref:Ribosomal RNA small subunit methyltransferase I n=1 Tax=Spiroplasma chrysopicola DF-1 TaxID=1276227 RepID=R4U2Q1_9MOLU|nr:16S rRNA (cytidine(1402)-2'-O)-methyltransferase [Spiroplasma chrysopicola]AGM24753.1 methyltransferase [Spiroplasma chrysopicola DF-1]
MANNVKQYSFKSELPTVYLVATPIGNLGEMTPRAVDVLMHQVAKIYCEDTRNTLKLLNHFGIHKELVSLNKDNEKERYAKIVGDLTNNLSIAIVSDAGYPLISDPGYYIINSLIAAQNCNIVPLSGANAALNALVASGLNPTHFLFYGFLAAQGAKKKEQLASLRELPYTTIFYESPHRLLATLESIHQQWGNRLCCVVKELTKIHEQFYRGTIAELLAFLPKEANIEQGEYVIVVAGYDLEANKDSPADLQLIQEIDFLIKNNNYRIKQAIDIIANKYDISKNILYNMYHKSIGDEDNETKS